MDLRGKMSEEKKYPLKLVADKKEQAEIVEAVAMGCAWILPFLNLTAESLKRKRKLKCFKSDSYPDFDATMSGERTKMVVFQVSRNRLVALTNWVGEDMFSGFTGFKNEVFVFLGYSLDDLNETNLTLLVANPQVWVCADHNWYNEKPPKKCLSCRVNLRMNDDFDWKLIDYVRKF